MTSGSVYLEVRFFVIYCFIGLMAEESENALKVEDLDSYAIKPMKQ